MKKQIREQIFNKYSGKCAYCGTDLEKGWHIDHIEPVVRDSKWSRYHGRFVPTGKLQNPENEHIDNYNPSCASCNIQKNSFTLEEFRKNIKNFVNSLNNYSTQYKFAKRYGLITETKEDVIFYFEKLNNEQKNTGS